VSGQVFIISYMYQVSIMVGRHITRYHTSNIAYHVSRLLLIMSANINYHI